MNNSTTDGCPVFEEGMEIKLNGAEQLIVETLYSLVSLLAVGGNAIVIYIVIHFRRMRSATNYFIVNLAAADILMAVLCIPFTYWPILILNYWPFGLVLCKLLNFCQAMSVVLSSYTLIAISIDKFVGIMMPFRPKTTNKMALRAILFIWVIAIITPAPLLIVQKTYEGPGNQTQCDENWFGDEQLQKISQLAFTWVLAILTYLFPLVVLLLTYLGIGVKIWYSEVPGVDKTVKDKRREEAKRLIMMMFIVSLIYTLCWLPLNTLMFILSRCHSYASHPYIYYIFFGCHFIAMSHSMVNPIVYFLSYERFREGFKFVFKFLPCVKYDPATCKLDPHRGTTVRSSHTDYSSKKPRLTSVNSEHSRLLSYRGGTDNGSSQSATVNGGVKPTNSLTPNTLNPSSSPNGVATVRRHMVTVNGQTIAAIEGDKESLC